MVNDVKGVLDEIRAILDQVPKMPEMPVMSDTIYDQFNITDYIPGMSSPREDPPQPPVIIAPQNAQDYPEKDPNSYALNSTIASSAKGKLKKGKLFAAIHLTILTFNPNSILIQPQCIRSKPRRHRVSINR